MCAFFGRGLTTYDVPLRIRAAAAVGGVPVFEVGLRAASLVGTRAVQATPAFDTPVMRAHTWPTARVVITREVPDRVNPPAGIHRLAWPAIAAAVRLPAIPPMVAPVRQAGPVPAPRMHAALDAARAQPVRKRLVPADALAPADAAGWVRRLADSKKMAKTRLVLVGVFPDVPLIDGAPVRYDAAAGAIAYALPEQPVALSTVVIARRTDTNEAVIGRFYK